MAGSYKNMQLVILIFITLLVASCKTKTSWTYNSFFDQNFKLIQENSIMRDKIDWICLKKTVADSIKKFSTNEDVYKAIEYTIKLVNDGHSLFVWPNTQNKLDNTTIVPEIKYQLIDRSIGYILIPGFVAKDSLSQLFSENVRKVIIELDNQTELTGWIVDLRENGGGKESSMLLGISPLFADSLVGYSQSNSGKFEELFCANYFIMNNCILDSLPMKRTLRSNDTRIAVLVNKNTASAGELLTLALQSQDNVKIFGEATRGKTSHLRLFTYKSNAKLLLAVSYYCDNKKNVKTGPIIPDIECPDPNSLELALEWIKK